MVRCHRGILYPAVFLFLLVVIIPIIYLLLSPFWDHGCFSYHYLTELLLDSRQLHLLGTSLLLAGTATLLSLLLGLPYALIIERINLPGRFFFALACIIPLLIPPYIQAIILDSIVSDLMSSIAIPPLIAASVSLAFSYFPYVTLLVMGGLRGLQAGYEEAGLIHRGKWPTLLRVTVPLIAPHVLTGAFFVFVFSIIDFGVPDIFRLRVYPVEIFIQFSGLYNCLLRRKPATDSEVIRPPVPIQTGH